MEGTIFKALSGFYYADTADGILECRARGRFRKDGETPLVGDCAEITPLGNGKGILERILPRKNEFLRPAVSNIDQMVIVASAAIPETDPFLIDRLAVVARLRNCGVVVCVNKCDLNHGDFLVGLYRKAGFPVARVSAETGEGISELIPLITGRVSVFTGNSGVGKTSILNALEPGFHLRVGEVSEKLGRGRHTTRHVELFRLSCGAVVTDTPGFSSFDADLLDLNTKARLPWGMPEFEPYLGKCRFSDCSHTKEQGCAVLEAVAQGKIQPSRHESYRKLYELLKDKKEWEQL
ncbi:ribosome small subunit-dependent GTPase A [Papillibacter cinnamivorans]|uniref:Small ribosomal subunit biogenesis GTPase RsgA n=1 Tax=Papillibacter cinnamivorans DSM 12816 TaxID=1122930 RepID=A0A1W1YW91_9FIRM|nr:ribosome small subunit-dependent GTPase A [Papillibacter cinnamivorans]SMC40352.1 ribosome biogenesis GTPase [Papillibacter cinnamivorans DSM 12816]